MSLPGPRLHQAILIFSTLVGSWLGMQAVHESGHIVAAWLTGGTVTQVVLDPRTLSRTDVSPNLHPLAVAWAGPCLGVLGPLLLWAVACAFGLPGAFVVRFFAGFCLLANGLYIAFGSLDAVGDCGDMLRQGTPIWVLWLFGLATAPAGLWLWHGQGPQFGFGAASPVSPCIAYATLAIALALVAIGFAVGGR